MTESQQVAYDKMVQKRRNLVKKTTDEALKK